MPEHAALLESLKDALVPEASDENMLSTRATRSSSSTSHASSSSFAGSAWRDDAPVTSADLARPRARTLGGAEGGTGEGRLRRHELALGVDDTRIRSVPDGAAPS